MGEIKFISRREEEGRIVSDKINMGKPVFRTSQIPMISDHYVFVDQGLAMDKVQNEVYNGTALAIEAPHFVTFMKDIDNLNLEEFGPRFDKHHLFPEGVNTEFAEILDKNTLKLRTWKQGGGEDAGSRTGACAAAIAGIMLDRAGKHNEPVTVVTKDAVFKVTYMRDETIYLEEASAAV